MGRVRRVIQNGRILRVVLTGAILGLAGCAATPPQDADNVCRLFEQYPYWYDDAMRAEERWGTPVHVKMSFVYQESSFRRQVRPERNRILGIIPGRRPSSAYGYAQIQDPAWEDYMNDAGRRGAQRTNMRDALDFIGWYNDISKRRLGLDLDDARSLYLAYHEGHTGYQQGTWQDKPGLQQAAARVETRAGRYREQLEGCRADFQCRRWYQVWPFCRADG